MSNTPKPLISVVIASYQHEAFILEAIQSILNQSFQDFEIIITDDGSSDNSIEKIKTLTDPRITLFEFKENQGACAATNNCIIHARGEYIAVMNSDDVWVKKKLQKQIDFLTNNEHISAVFSSAELYDENLNEISLDNVFNQRNRTSAEWLYKFFYEGNCLCHPSILIKKSCYDVLGLYDNRYRQLPDFDMWIRFCKKYSLHVLPDKLVKFRLLSNNQNASSQTYDNQIRGRNEFHLIMQSFFDNMEVDTFKDAFSKQLRNKNFTTSEEFEIEKTLIYLGTVHSITGIEKLFSLLGNERFAKILKENYGITDKEFLQITSKQNRFSYTTRPILINDAIREILYYPNKIKLLKHAFKYIIKSMIHILKRK